MRVRWAITAVWFAGTALQAAPGEDLFQAIRNGDLAGLKRQLADGADLKARDARGNPPLIYAAGFGSAEAVKMLLDAGADVNARNGLEATALIWGAADIDKLKLLLAHGADVNAHSRLGRTPLMLAASCDGCSENVRLLIEKGADAKAVDKGGTDALAMAAQAGDAESVRLLLAHGADARVADQSGLTALMLALTNCSLPAVSALVEHGADVNAANTFAGKVRFGDIDLKHLTPAHIAAPYCNADVMKLLVDAGAKVNVDDSRGMTPLMLAVSSEHQDAALVRLLLKSGADPNARSKTGETVLDWARKYGDPAVLETLQKAGAKDGGALARAQFHFGEPPQRAAAGKPVARNTAQSAEAATALMEQSATQFFKQAGCVGCHHQAFALMASATARKAGIHVNHDAAAGFVQQIEAETTPQKEPLMERIDPGGAMDGECYMLQALAAEGYAPSGVTDTAAVHIAAMQHRAGNWHVGDVSRSPIQESDIARTARCLHALQVYGVPSRKAEFQRRVARARAWLEEARPLTTDDFAMRVVGLAWSASREAAGAAAKALAGRQRGDGGWAQNDRLASDAYATGESLWALAESGAMSASDPAYRRGVKFLLDNQWPDGSWYVRSRAPKFQPYFQSGFPFDHDQWVSSAATGWAVMGLAPAIEKERAAR